MITPDELNVLRKAERAIGRLEVGCSCSESLEDVAVLARVVDAYAEYLLLSEESSHTGYPAVDPPTDGSPDDLVTVAYMAGVERGRDQVRERIERITEESIARDEARQVTQDAPDPAVEHARSVIEAAAIATAVPPIQAADVSKPEPQIDTSAASADGVDTKVCTRCGKSKPIGE